jgi:hypothetical protein
VAERRLVIGLGLTPYWLRKKLIRRKEGKYSPYLYRARRGMILEILLGVF